MKKKLIIFIILGIMTVTLTGCEALFGDSADTVSHNLSREADEFKVKRRITFINLRTGDYLFQATGNCSVKGGLENTNDELELICRIGEDKKCLEYCSCCKFCPYYQEKYMKGDE